MRHSVFGRKLGRDTNARKALLSNLASDLLINEKITTTLAKAKFASSYVEKMITAAKRNKLHSRRTISSAVTHEAFLKLIGQVAPGYSDRTGGYTRIVKLGQRQGDAAKLARIELLEREKIVVSQKPEKAKKEAKPKGASVKKDIPAPKMATSSKVTKSKKKSV